MVVPCYNYGRYLPQCVASVLSQEGVEVDVLIVDDASPDGSAAVARELATDPRVRVIEHVTNQGHIATYNEGLAKASGEYVVLLSADDLLSPGSLARATDLLEAHPEVGLVYGFSCSFAEQPPRPRPRTRSWSIWTGPQWLTENSVRGTNPIATPEVVMRTSIMRELEGYDPRVPHAADFLLWLRAAARAGVGRVNGVDQAFYRVHGTNMHATEFAGMYHDITERASCFEIVFGEEAERVAGLGHLHDAAKRALARAALVTAIRAYRLEQTEAEDPRRLAELAERIWPESRTWRLRRRYERYARHATPVQRWLPLPTRRFAWRAEHRVRWGLWRWRGYRV